MFVNVDFYETSQVTFRVYTGFVGIFGKGILKKDHDFCENF